MDPFVVMGVMTDADTVMKQNPVNTRSTMISRVKEMVDLVIIFVIRFSPAINPF